VQSQRDPELWHVAAIAVVNYLGDPQGFLVWVFEQPEVTAPLQDTFSWARLGLSICAGSSRTTHSVFILATRRRNSSVAT
jgi:hypothetical protein